MQTIKEILKWLIGLAYWSLFNLRNKSQVWNYRVSIKSKLGRRVMIRRGTYIYGHISLGDFSYISGPNTFVNGAHIGRYCHIARNVTIGPGNSELSAISTHPFLYSDKYEIIKESIHPQKNSVPVLANDIWVGTNSIIMNNVTIGDGAIVAAGSVVTKDVAPYAVVGGVPAKLIKYRFSEDIICKLMDIKWWNWDEITLRNRATDFYNVSDFLEKYKKEEKK